MFAILIRDITENLLHTAPFKCESAINAIHHFDSTVLLCCGCLRSLDSSCHCRPSLSVFRLLQVYKQFFCTIFLALNILPLEYLSINSCEKLTSHRILLQLAIDAAASASVVNVTRNLACKNCATVNYIWRWMVGGKLRITLK